MQIPFRTVVEVKPFPFRIDFNTPVMMLGSCFTENIGAMLAERKLPALVNPVGVIYNPVSTALVLQRVISAKPYTEDDLNQYNGLWYSFHHHTSFSHIDKSQCLSRINDSLQASSKFWHSSKYLMVTFGTARVYHYKKTGLPVANCHKLPAREFDHSLLTVEEITTLWRDLINEIVHAKPDLKIVFTVSPVRHWKDGAVGNQISKSTLLLAVSQLVSDFSDRVFYFPSYEIVMDDLRDYRFYADDMLHPSPQAISYIWERFKDWLIDSTAHKLMGEIEKIRLAINHRPLNTGTQEYRDFINSTISKIEQIQKQHPNIDFSPEIATLKLRLES
ncbi:MAG: GSCFA domain-containing protein [Tenuifilaceae bacterium]|jgi:hypothetical protein|nr:GSCFA domain-containing protein [Tenuifilaceae bacterium]